MAGNTGTSPATMARAVGGGGVEYAVRAVLGLVMVPVLLRVLGANAYGTWVVLAALFSLGSLADLGVRTEVTRRVAAAWGRGDRPGAARVVREGASILALAGVSVALVGTALAPPLVRAVLDHRGGAPVAHLVVMVRVVAVLVGATLCSDGYFAALRGVQRSDVESISRAVGEVAGSMLAIVWVLRGGGLWALVAGLALQLAVDVAGRSLGTRRLLPELQPRPARPAHVRTWLFAGGLLALSQVSDVVDTQWDKLVLARYVGPAASAAYNVGTTLAGQAKVLVVVPLLPLVAASAELHRRNPEELTRVFRRLSSASLALAGVAFGGVVVCGPAFVALWLGGHVPPGAAVAAQLSAIAVWCNVLAAPLAMRLIGEGLGAIPGIAAASNIVVNGTVSLVLTMHIGFDGALVGSIGGNVAGLVVLAALSWRRGVLRPPPFRVVVGGAVVTAAAWAAFGGDVRGWARMLIAAGLYVVAQAAVVLVVVPRDERRAWQAALARVRSKPLSGV